MLLTRIIPITPKKTMLHSTVPPIPRRYSQSSPGYFKPQLLRSRVIMSITSLL